jgi:signal transduction histidine kinase
MVRRKLTDNELTKYLNRADQSHDEMRHILNAVADTTSLEVTIMRAQKHNINLSKTLEERIGYFALVHPSIHINASIEPNVFIHGNHELFDQLVDKLVNNAIEHHTEGSAVSFYLSVREMQCLIIVQNYGPQLPSLDESIFDLFVSTKANANRGNLGMGLYIAKLITEFHNGSIHAQSINKNNQSGAKFTVTLPILIE